MMNYQSDTVGQIVTEARKNKGWEIQRILARKASVDPAYLNNVEKDRLLPSIEIGTKLANVLGLDLKSFIFLILRTKHPDIAHVFNN